MSMVNTLLKKHIMDAVEKSFLTATTFGTLSFDKQIILDILNILFR